MPGIDVDYERIGYRRQEEADGIAEEISIVEEYKSAFDTALLLIASVMLNKQLSMLKIAGKVQLSLTQLYTGPQKQIKFKK